MEGHTMIIRKALIALASAGLVLGTTAAKAAPAPMNDVRVSSSVDQSENFSSFGWVVAVLIFLGVLGVVLADDSQKPISV
jgi:hypothetical protein